MSDNVPSENTRKGFAVGALQLEFFMKNRCRGPDADLMHAYGGIAVRVHAAARSAGRPRTQRGLFLVTGTEDTGTGRGDGMAPSLSGQDTGPRQKSTVRNDETAQRQQYLRK